jgi:iron complex transport system substrate-binding protein
MDQAVREALHAGKGLYTVNSALLASLKPDLIVTQSLCEVCSVDLCLVEKVAAGLSPAPRILSLNPQNLDEVLDDLLRVGEALGTLETAKEARAALLARVERATAAAAAPSISAPSSAAADGETGDQNAPAAVALVPSNEGKSVAFLEWVEPIFIGGHWTPELIRMAGARHPLNPSRGRGHGAGKSVSDT